MVLNISSHYITFKCTPKCCKSKPNLLMSWKTGTSPGSLMTTWKENRQLHHWVNVNLHHLKKVTLHKNLSKCSQLRVTWKTKRILHCKLIIEKRCWTNVITWQHDKSLTTLIKHVTSLDQTKNMGIIRMPFCFLAYNSLVGILMICQVVSSD